MRIIISPAKNMRDYQSLNMKIDTPIFIDKAKNILSKLKALSKSELTTLWRCNSKIVDALYEALHSTNLNQDLIPAIFRYDGLVYKNINPSTFNESELYYINKNLTFFETFMNSLYESFFLKWKPAFFIKIRENSF